LELSASSTITSTAHVERRHHHHTDSHHHNSAPDAAALLTKLLAKSEAKCSPNLSFSACAQEICTKFPEFSAAEQICCQVLVHGIMKNDLASEESGSLKIEAAKFAEFVIKCPGHPLDMPAELPAGWIKAVDSVGEALYVDLHLGISQYTIPQEQDVYNNQELYQAGEVPNMAETFFADDADIIRDCPAVKIDEEEETTTEVKSEVPAPPPGPISVTKENRRNSKQQPPSEVKPTTGEEQQQEVATSDAFLQDSSNATQDPDSDEDYKVLLSNLHHLKSRFARHNSDE
jgi:hypothetical protein